jgi:hypothetical protein
MATAKLVESDIEIGRQIVATLTRASIPVRLYLWAFIPQIQEWQFIVATPLIDTKGPLAAYGDVNKALQKEGVFEDVPMRRIFLKSPNDRVLKALEKESRAVPHEDYRVVNAPIMGSFVEDAYVYTGFIHVVQLRNYSPDHPKYSVMYVSYPGGLVPSVTIDGPQQLRTFLGDQLHIHQESIESALRNIGKRGNAAIPNVELKTGELKRLGLL